MQYMYVAKDYNPEYIKSSHKRKTNIPIENQAKFLHRRLIRDNIQMANKHIKRYSTSILIRKMQIISIGR